MRSASGVVRSRGCLRGGAMGPVAAARRQAAAAAVGEAPTGVVTVGGTLGDDADPAGGAEGRAVSCGAGCVGWRRRGRLRRRGRIRTGLRFAGGRLVLGGDFGAAKEAARLVELHRRIARPRPSIQAARRRVRRRRPRRTPWRDSRCAPADRAAALARATCALASSAPRPCEPADPASMIRFASAFPGATPRTAPAAREASSNLPWSKSAWALLTPSLTAAAAARDRCRSCCAAVLPGSRARTARAFARPRCNPRASKALSAFCIRSVIGGSVATIGGAGVTAAGGRGRPTVIHRIAAAIMSTITAPPTRRRGDEMMTGAALPEAGG